MRYFDPLRLTLLVAALGLPGGGFVAAVWLEARHGVVPELATAKVLDEGSEGFGALPALMLGACRTLHMAELRSSCSSAYLGCYSDPLASRLEGSEANA